MTDHTTPRPARRRPTAWARPAWALPLLGSGCVSYATLDTPRLEVRSPNAASQVLRLETRPVQNARGPLRALVYPEVHGGPDVTVREWATREGSFHVSSLTWDHPYLCLLTIPLDLLSLVVTPFVAFGTFLATDEGELARSGPRALEAGVRLPFPWHGPAALRVSGRQDPFRVEVATDLQGAGYAALGGAFEPAVQAAIAWALAHPGERAELRLELAPDAAPSAFARAFDLRELLDLWFTAVVARGGAPGREFEDGFDAPPTHTAPAALREALEAARTRFASWEEEQQRLRATEAAEAKRSAAARMARAADDAAEEERIRAVQRRGGGSRDVARFVAVNRGCPDCLMSGIAYRTVGVDWVDPRTGKRLDRGTEYLHEFRVWESSDRRGPHQRTLHVSTEVTHPRLDADGRLTGWQLENLTEEGITRDPNLKSVYYPEPCPTCKGTGKGEGPAASPR